MEKIRVNMTSRDQIGLGNLNPEEVQSLEGMALGHRWCIVTPEGRLRTHSRWEPLPAPAQDETMMPFWQSMLPGPTQMEFREVPVPLGSQAGIIIESVCGYYYTPENYRTETAKLEEFGFECLRSRRGPDGRFWEMWYLSGAWSAQGQLKGTLVGIKDPKEQVDEMVRFLCRNVQFGSLSVSWQRAAMVIED
jgi:hypothetical protein